MSLPSERARALINTRNFLRRMISPYNGGVNGIPKDVRRECKSLLKHYPMSVELILALKPKNKYICIKELNRLNTEELCKFLDHLIDTRPNKK